MCFMDSTIDFAALDIESDIAISLAFHIGFSGIIKHALKNKLYINRLGVNC